MKAVVTSGLLIMALSAAVTTCQGADASYAPVANVTERWTNDALWKVTGAGTPAVVDQTMRLAYAAPAFPIPKLGGVYADATASSGRFAGNYINSGITHASFDVMRVGLFETAYLQFSSTNGHLWKCAFPLPENDSVWEHREVSLLYSEQWSSDTASGQATFDADKTQVKKIQVYVGSTGGGAEQLRIDNFKVVGPWERGPLTDDEMPLYWLIENGLPAQAGQAGLDKDGDGFNNFAEYLAGTDPSDAASQFRIAIETDADGKPVLSWKRESYRNYKVFKAADLSAADSFVEETGAIQAVGEKNQMQVSGASSEPAFFRVKVEKQ